MYLYLYDSFLNNKKHSGLLARIETRLTDLGIGGKIFRLSPLRNTEELLNDEVKGGVKTIVVVGNDTTITNIINLAAKLNITVGIIPVGPGNKIAQTLGINSPEEATDILAARKIEKVDLGKINETYFLSNITIDEGDVTIECENKFRLKTEDQNQISICNLRPLFTSNWNHTNYFNPQDGMLEILVQPLRSKLSGIFKKSTQTKDSIIPFKKLAIRSRGSVSIITDGQKTLKTPVKIEIVPKKLRLVVGKNRMF